MTKKPTGKHAIVIGGSLGGLFTDFAALDLDVNIYERSDHDLESRWRYCAQPDVVEAFQRGISDQPLGVVARVRYYLNPDGSIAQPMPMRQILSSWNLLYGSMRRHFPTKHYHSGKHLSDIQHSGEQVTAIFADETRDTADLLIGADGPNSTVRQRFLPDVHYRYAGYVAYRVG